MKVIADTNILLRITTADNEFQAGVAREALRDAETIAISLPALCEFCWTLSRGYKKRPNEVAAALRQWIAIKGVSLDTAAVSAGLDMLDAGGDFADGVIAFEGKRLGGDTFVTFDRDAVALLEHAGQAARLLPASGPR